MTPRRWIWSLSLILGLVLGADYLFLHVLFPLKKEELTKEWTRKVDESLGLSNPSIPASDPSSTVLFHEKEQEPVTATPVDFQDQLRRCLDPQSDATSPERLIQKMEDELKIKNTEIQSEVWHIRLSDGREQRLMKIPSDRENAKGKSEVRLFDVDSEGLPVPVELKAEDSLDPREDFVQSLLSQGQIIHFEKRESRVFQNGNSVLIQWINGEIHDLQVFTKAKTFACREQSCRCF